MLQLASKPISNRAQDRLNHLQSSVDGKPTFNEKAAEAIRLWDNKKSSAVGRAVFDEIKETLSTMCVSVEICNYCEQNEANDIEHIYPKSLFPNQTFRWENYLLSCKQCNTAYKSDSFSVLDLNHEIIDLPRNTEPPYTDGAFINPRIDNPTDFMLMNTSSFTFEVLPNLGKRNTHKAVRTIELLQLNNRDTLIHARKSTAVYFFQTMSLLVKILGVQTIPELKDLLSPYEDEISDTLLLDEVREHLKQSFKQNILSQQHPSVWHAIKTIESKTNPKWEQIFNAFPDALLW